MRSLVHHERVVDGSAHDVVDAGLLERRSSRPSRAKVMGVSGWTRSRLAVLIAADGGALRYVRNGTLGVQMPVRGQRIRLERSRVKLRGVVTIVWDQSVTRWLVRGDWAGLAVCWPRASRRFEKDGFDAKFRCSRRWGGGRSGRFRLTELETCDAMGYERTAPACASPIS
jgi:hypothetical protein